MKKICLMAIFGVAPMLATSVQADTVKSTAAPSVAGARMPVAMFSVPEPASVGILAAGGFGLLLRRRKAR
jgi:hypothetical protein